MGRLHSQDAKASPQQSGAGPRLVSEDAEAVPTGADAAGAADARQV